MKSCAAEPSVRNRQFPGRRAAIAALTLLAAWSLSGCVVAPLPPPGYPATVGPGPGAVVIAPQAPPPVVVEPMLVAPGPGYIWIEGYWSWTGGHHVWTRGHWAAPRSGYHWVPRQWTHGPGGWHQHGGHWAR